MDKFIINVALLGQHAFTVHPPMGSTEAHAVTIAHKVMAAFPKHDGYEVRLTAWIESGRDVTVKGAS